MSVEHGTATALEKDIMNLEQLKEFLGKNIFKGENGEFTHCVDGRYEEGSLAARPGADAGYVMVVMGVLRKMNADLGLKVAMDSVLEAVGGVEKFSFHSDDHEVPAGVDERMKVGIGCGHLKHAYNDPSAYGLMKEDMEFLMNQLTEMQDKMHRDELKGHHEEQAVLVIESAEYGVAPKVDNGKFYESFVFQSSADGKKLEEIANILFEKIGGKVERGVLVKYLQEVSEMQLNETVGRLAKGLPVYRVKIDEGGEYEILA